ncbi:MAG TPA: hypothetical protein ENG51_09775 [Deltaproteobacteria bacterium]|nr:hypothetical protein [Deltaproteobacteria bacterium]
MNKFVICVNSKGCEASLEKWKLYPVLEEDEVSGFIRIIDETKEDYLYPKDYFLAVELPVVVAEKLEKEYFAEIEEV